LDTLFFIYLQKKYSNDALVSDLSSDDYNTLPESPISEKTIPEQLEPLDIVSTSHSSWRYYLKLLGYAKHYIGAVNLCFMCSSTVYPGVVSLISSPTLGDWLPVMLFTIFQMGDFLGRLLVRWAPEGIAKGGTSGGSQLLIYAIIRIFIFIPSLTILAHFGYTHPSTTIDILSCIIVSFLSVTNGYIGTLAMMYARTSIPFDDSHIKEKEFVGMTMPLFLLLGLSIGAGWGLVLEAIFFKDIV